QEIMHRHIVFIRPENSVADAISVFTDYDFQQLPVLDSERRVVGTIYQKDLLSIATQSPDLVKKRPVGSVMKAPLPQIDKNTEIMKIKPILENWDAIIVTENGKAIGIVTIYDILKNV
ncbi:MAG: CBS domain-containing protein, partial [Candidatus Micrarchaeota archaeon]|nr:CBS domain-containing protein [Candidatus Micrarchaeota archaeon]